MDCIKLFTDGQESDIATIPLNEDEKVVFRRCEEVIHEGMTSFVEVGGALATIRDGRLYRITHKTFERYVQERWDVGRSYASRLIGAAETVNVLPKGNTMPSTETHVRPILQFPLEDRAEVWDTVVKMSGGNLTARSIDKIVKSQIRFASDGAFKRRRLELKRKCKDEKRGTDGRPTVRNLATSAMQMVYIAISHLERIKVDDPERDKALAKISKWIADQRGGDQEDDA